MLNVMYIKYILAIKIQTSVNVILKASAFVPKNYFMSFLLISFFKYRFYFAKRSVAKRTLLMLQTLYSRDSIINFVKLCTKA